MAADCRDTWGNRISNREMRVFSKPSTFFWLVNSVYVLTCPILRSFSRRPAVIGGARGADAHSNGDKNRTG